MDEKISLGMADKNIGLEVMITFDPFLYEPGDVSELEGMLLSVANRWWKGRAIRERNRGSYVGPKLS